jgi:hypothetical protein
MKHSIWHDADVQEHDAANGGYDGDSSSTGTGKIKTEEIANDS